MVEGGYQRVDSDNQEIIPANALIPFGYLRDFPCNFRGKSNVDVSKSSHKLAKLIDSQKREIRKEAENYASGVKVPFYELDISCKSSSSSSLRSWKHGNLESRAKIQLYVWNRK
jgi:hypothetical protein